jgi:hypothetical protein
MSYNDDDDKELNMTLGDDGLPDDDLDEPLDGDDLPDDDSLDDEFAGLDGSEY